MMLPMTNDDNPTEEYEEPIKIRRIKILRDFAPVTGNVVCKRCKNQMVRRFEKGCLLTYPWQLKWYWWCMCGYALDGGLNTGENEADIAEDEWRKVNGKPKIKCLDTDSLDAVADIRARRRERPFR